MKVIFIFLIIFLECLLDGYQKTTWKILKLISISPRALLECYWIEVFISKSYEAIQTSLQNFIRRV